MAKVLMINESPGKGDCRILTMYHGSPKLFNQFDLSHVLEGDGKVKFGYGVYLTSSFSSAAHYSGVNPTSTMYYVYTVEIPVIREDNHIDFKQAVNTSIIKRTEEKLGLAVPEKVTKDGKDFRKYLAKTLTGAVNLAGEMAAAEFLDSISVDYIIWPYSWKNPDLGFNCAVFDARKIRIKQVHQVELDTKKKLIDSSSRIIWSNK